MIRALEEQVAHWKTKYETISKMYAQLRKEHLDLLTRFKDVQGKAASAQLAIAEKEKLSVAFRQKTEQLATVTQECTLLKAEFERMKKHSLEEAAQLRREVTESQARLEQWSSAKGAETQELVAKFSAAQQESAARFQMSSDEAERLKSELNESRALFARLQDDLAAKDEEISVLQAGMDQSLLALQQIHEKQSTSEVAFLGKIDSMSLEHRLQTDKIMGKRKRRWWSERR